MVHYVRRGATILLDTLCQAWSYYTSRHITSGVELLYFSTHYVRRGATILLDTLYQGWRYYASILTLRGGIMGRLYTVASVATCQIKWNMIHYFRRGGTIFMSDVEVLYFSTDLKGWNCGR